MLLSGRDACSRLVRSTCRRGFTMANLLEAMRIFVAGVEHGVDGASSAAPTSLQRSSP
ncbi:hypothetical protein EMIT0158MI4_80166 [Burkholderia ambifaria]